MAAKVHARLWTVDMTERTVTIPVKQHPTMLIPNYNGSGYGRFIISREYVHELTKRLLSTTNDLTRYAIALTLYENYLNGVHDKDYFTELFRTLKKEKNPLKPPCAVTCTSLPSTRNRHCASGWRVSCSTLPKAVPSPRAARA